MARGRCSRCKPRFAELLPSRAEARASVGPIGRGTVIGFLIGIIPGSAHILSSFVSYAVEKKLSDHPERFGKGAVEGVAGPESANNAAACGAFVPMLALGVPLGPVQAILIAVLVVHGIAPGPLLITPAAATVLGLHRQHVYRQSGAVDSQPAAGRPVRVAAANPLHLSLPGDPGLLHRRRVHGEPQHGRGADHGGWRAPPDTACASCATTSRRSCWALSLRRCWRWRSGSRWRCRAGNIRSSCNGRSRSRCWRSALLLLTIGADPGGLAPASTPERSSGRNQKKRRREMHACVSSGLGSSSIAVGFAGQPRRRPRTNSRASRSPSCSAIRPAARPTPPRGRSRRCSSASSASRW